MRNVSETNVVEKIRTLFDVQCVYPEVVSLMG